MTVRHADSPAVVVGDALAQRLSEELGVQTVGELLRYTPMRYVRRGESSGASLPEKGEWLTLVGTVTRADERRMKQRSGTFLSVTVDDGLRTYGVTFFNPRVIKRVLRPGVRLVVAGTVGYFRDQIQLTHPDWLVLPDAGAPALDAVGSPMLAAMAADATKGTGVNGEGAEGTSSGGLEIDPADFDRPVLPIYRATKALQTWTIWKAIQLVLDAVAFDDDALTESERAERELITTAEAIRRIHMPESQEDIDAASTRLRFDEALAMQVALAQRRFADRGRVGPACEHVPGRLEDRFVERLPFTLTAGQRTVLDEICADLDGGEPMSRLLQGEVGSGKTLVALLCMLRMVDNGRQCVLLAPTEVLAAQHHRTISRMLGELAIAGELGADPDATAIALLTGSLKTQARREAMLATVTGTAGIVIGTHALLEEKVEFFDLGLIVVDEQHRFGVEQRDTLRSRGRGDAIPHMLVMTATPIPRTIAMTVYGDLETSTLRELPAGRQPITTNVVPAAREKWERRLWEVVDEEVREGRQVYVVCSRIGDDGTPEGARSAKRAAEGQGDDRSGRPTTSAVDMFAQLTGGPLGRHRIELLHGRLHPEDKTAVMDAFTRGEVDILVSTTVIEVGVDVANATTMVIVDADRFGVSQLHQLRGRVGRGGLPGRCFLRTSASDGSPSMERLTAVAASNDGFELARIDLITRREGDVLGAVQSGSTSSLRFLSLVDDVDVIDDARGFAADVVRDDLTLAEHRPLADLLDAVMGPARVRYLDKS
ncbi:ATP-dependent DNA helicase RecG [Williamsia deligens]|uniref:ATP-dependent DNA helicase RecG n=1 Tax=Williamsia deligens TaxID=321325 RepID=A0ABW3G4V8_9NOCA|nr:ATP-dependent DNA helicase RecG [Williamsia deligens]MCP2195090.1 ATP-dependent DNA helicase RecG [Williamsia deligens]